MPQLENNKLNVKIVIIGEASVGKTSLMSSFISDTFSDQMQPTIGCDIQNKTMCVEGQNVDIRLWDTAGCERFQSMLPLYYRGCHGAILVYDITRRETFTKLRDWIIELDNNLTNDCAIKMIIGNKIDKNGRQVSKEEGSNYAKQRSALFIETSAKTNEGVAIAFEELLVKIMQTPGLMEKNSVGFTLNQSDNEQTPCNWLTGYLSAAWNYIF